jgi:hypothetical protein
MSLVLGGALGGAALGGLGGLILGGPPGAVIGAVAGGAVGGLLGSAAYSPWRNSFFTPPYFQPYYAYPRFYAYSWPAYFRPPMFGYW